MGNLSANHLPLGAVEITPPSSFTKQVCGGEGWLGRYFNRVSSQASTSLVALLHHLEGGATIG